MGEAFQNQQEQNQELTALLEEREKEAEELANLVRNKDEVVKNLERCLERKSGHTFQRKITHKSIKQAFFDLKFQFFCKIYQFYSQSYFIYLIMFPCT